MPQTVEKAQQCWAFSIIYDIIIMGDEKCWNVEKWNEEYTKSWTPKVWCLRSICCVKLTQQLIGTSCTIVDSTYKTPHICKKVFGDDRILYTPYKRPQTMKGGHEWWKYVYDEYYDCIICPEYQILKYSTTNRDGYREYKSNPQVCANCPTRALCTRNKDFIKTVTQHIWKPYVDMAEELRYTERHKRYYKMRKETIERVFADAKENHGLRYTRYTGLAQVTNWVRLKFAAMNLKKFAIRKWEDTHNLLQILIFCPKSIQNPSFA